MEPLNTLSFAVMVLLRIPMRTAASILFPRASGGKRVRSSRLLDWLEHQDLPAALSRLEISLSHGAEWKALISRYIGTIPLSEDVPCISAQSISGLPPRTPVSSAMRAKVGAAARASQSAAPRATARPRPLI